MKKALFMLLAAGSCLAVSAYASEATVAAPGLGEVQYVSPKKSVVTTPTHVDVQSISIKAKGCLGDTRSTSVSTLPFFYSVVSRMDTYETGVYITITPEKKGEFDVIVNEYEAIWQRSFDDIDLPEISNQEYRGRMTLENDVWKKVDLNPDLFGENCSMEIKAIWFD